MRILRVIAALILVIGITGCSCRAKKIGDGEIPMAEGDAGPLKDVHFAFDSYALDASAKSILGANASWLKENARTNVQIEGHCDERGTNEYNMALGANRARSAMDYLRSLGVDAKRMSTVSYGEEVPLDPRHNEEAWAKNRRAHHKVLN